ncbi:peptide chain release factor N(5)-glutamine methyltransferase [Fulvimarina sp. 2208YS6-2-32]|uniref:Release factor glutamine methyltransferase n=1 Tax=Fulvimarina uroteuthidis TaxID=3098149 RepID=A0ABU5I611_9HYPH|nr:peptide chain release factor N(5)-glutamine methyltransferase [Fulvimarina sp. 2208YS6-2-32]MDY8110532.1 peptide chain release factor N(5)-glutamine methyltransferase [Fulvimarina sp. 2208YS6-2-32]
MTDRGGAAASSVTIGAALRQGTARLRAANVATPDLDARLFMAEALGLEMSSLLARRERSLEEPARLRFSTFVERRETGEPAHRIIGRRGFYGHEFALSQGTLEPRQDTETLVDLALETLAAFGTDRRLRILDIGTGSGAIALSLLAACPNATCIGTDISADALRTAERNALALGVATRFEAMLGAYCADARGPFDLVVSNPPYIPSADIEGLSPEVRLFDPIEALDGGGDGLTAYRAIAARTRDVLQKDGSVIVEIGQGQDADVAAIFASQRYELTESRADLGGIVRAMHFR